ncbi:hypothetical protein EG327_002146 [Venturia inaequalis]|uniref:Ran guanine nucleotide release factor n=1 Tax=Venturia inaequalis TaxID=5025 RepID=A0A8H3ZF48_VENIN|nr:hypothetical protein EG327_002146 [Venturia inaequalis]
MSTFKSTELFGGALVADLPSTFSDISTIRQVPDHQEIYLDPNGFTNVIIEVNQRVPAEDASTDMEALKYHFKDIVATETDEVKFWSEDTASLTKMPDTPAFVLFATTHPVEGDNRAKDDFTGIMLILIRLEKQTTDILIAVNVPHIPGEYEKDSINLDEQKIGPHLEAGLAIRKHILETFEVKEWSLFAADE